MNPRRLVLACAAGLLFAACGPHVHVTNLNPSPHMFVARDAMAVEIFTTALPPRPYVEVAALAAEGGDADDHLDALRRKAGEMGCDALVFTTMPTSTTATGYNWRTGGVTTAKSTGGSSATCVVWTDPAPTPTPAPAP